MDNPVGVIVGVIFGIAGLIILLILLYVVWKRRKNPKQPEDESNPYNRYPILHYYSKKQSKNYWLPINYAYSTVLAHASEMDNGGCTGCSKMVDPILNTHISETT